MANGATSGRYERVRHLGAGGMAEVELARVVGPASFEKRVVIKRMLPSLLADAQLVSLFEREARLAALVEHPNVVQVSDFGRDDEGRPYLVMEFVDGVNLREALRAAWKQGGPDRRLMAHVIAQAAMGLAAVHDAVEPKTGAPLQLVHRDVSPDNLLLSKYGTVKVSDFGVARAMQEAPMTSPQLIRGKLAYVSPEQLRNEPVTGAADQFALGICMFEALCGARPFVGDSESAVMYAIAQGLRADVGTLAPGCDPRLVAIVDRCLENEAAARFPSCHAVAEALTRFVHDSGPPVSSAQVGAWVVHLTGVPLTPAVFTAGPEDDALSTAPALAARFSPPEPSLLPEVPVRPETPIAPKVTVLSEPPPPQQPPPQPAPVSVLAAPAATPTEASVEAPSARRWVIAAIVALVGAAGALAYSKAGQSPERVQIVVTAKPANATVVVDELEVGPTPWAGDLSATSAHVISVKAPGYQPWSTTLDAGVGGSLEASLRRR